MKLLSSKLQAFLAVINYKTVQAAAKELHLTQTAVTQRIKALETALSTCLFVRSRQGMQLTSEGKSLFQYCQQVQLLEGEVLSSISSETNKSIFICISGPATLMQTRIIPVCLLFLQKYPNVTFQFDIQDKEERIRALQHGYVHIAVIEQQFITAEFEHKILKPEVYVLVACKKWQQRLLKEILSHESIIDFDAQDQITFDYLKKYNLFEYANPKRHFVNRTDMLADLIAKGIGYGVMPLDVAKKYVTRKELIILNDRKTYAYPYALAWYPRPRAIGCFNEIIEACN